MPEGEKAIELNGGQIKSKNFQFFLSANYFFLTF